MSLARHGFLRALSLVPERVKPGEFPFTLPAVQALDGLAFDPKVTFLVGENGSGKSTILEALALALGFNAEGGSRNFNFATRRSESELHRALRVVRGIRRPRDGFFLRAESFFNAATYLEQIGVDLDAYGGRSLHEQSHGESFLALAMERFMPDGIFFLDEPEAALSPQGALSLLRRMRELAIDGAQFVVATHSPILMAYPDAYLYELSERGIERVDYRDTDHYRLTRSFLEDPQAFLRHLFA